MNYSIRPEIWMTERRCVTCNRYSCFEENAWAPCPYCLVDEIVATRARSSALERSNAALRGHITRHKRRR